MDEAEQAYRNALYYRSNMADMLYNLWVCIFILVCRLGLFSSGSCGCQCFCKVAAEPETQCFDPSCSLWETALLSHIPHRVVADRSINDAVLVKEEM